MKIFTKIAESRAKIKKLKDQKRSIGLVPTMGFLHDGHFSLIKQSVKENDFTVVTVFINPLQFGEGEDFELYPTDFKNDCELLEKVGVDMVFHPSIKELYLENFLTKVSVKKITEKMCGQRRPGHFDGVCAVITKLFNIFNPDNAYFGKKDYQQLQAIKKLVIDLNYDINIIGMPIIRERDGLAMSSRNAYLKDNERDSAICLYKSFNIVRQLLSQGFRNSEDIKKGVSFFIQSFENVKIDYIAIVDKETLEEIFCIDKSFLLALAVFIGKTRLIDNKIYEV